MCGGTVVEDIDQYNRVHEMLSVLSGTHNRDMDDVSSVCKRWDSDEVYYAVSNNLLDANLNPEDPTYIAGDLAENITGDVTAGVLNGVIGTINLAIRALT